MVRPRSLRVVFATGEVLDGVQRRVIEEYFAVPVADGYGSREAGFIAHDCREGSMHVTDENVIVEIIDDSGRPVQDGECGEIVVTHLDAYAMPLIRYRTGDVGRRITEGCACGRGLSRMEIVGGRRTDHLVASDGRMMHGLSLIYVLREMEHVERFQIRQNASGGVEVLVVPADTFDRADHRRIADGARALLGDATKLTVQLVDRLEATPSGKFRCVTSQALGQEAAV
jgi:phenylacetate-CoA ligase